MPLSKRVQLLTADVAKLERADASAGKILVHGTKASPGATKPRDYAALVKKVKTKLREIEADARKANMKNALERIAGLKNDVRRLGVVAAKTPSPGAAARPVIRLKEPKRKNVARSVLDGWSSSGYQAIQGARRNPSANKIPALSTFRTNYALQLAFASSKFRAPSAPPFVAKGKDTSAVYRVMSTREDRWESWKALGSFSEKGYSSFSRRAPRKARATEANFSAAIDRFGCGPAMLASAPRGDQVILVIRLFVRNISKGAGWLFFSQGKTGGRLYDDTFRSEFPEEEEVLLPPGKFAIVGAKEVLDTKCAAGIDGHAKKRVRTFEVDVGFKPFYRKPLIGFEAYDVYDLLGRADLLKRSKAELEVAALSLGHRFSHKTKAQLVDAIRDGRKKKRPSPKPGSPGATSRANALANAFSKIAIKRAR